MIGERLENYEPQNPNDYKDENGDWLELTAWPKVPAVAVCPNPECSFTGWGVEVDLVINVDGVFRSSCGVCGSPNDLFHRVEEDDPGQPGDLGVDSAPDSSDTPSDST